uniref:tRNA (34-2'-O)-methyltransferase regulator WDR6 n=1 Tax=Ditylenchus dipsaci TaxID=166011 RepID=A0A915E4S3_9BILA
MSCYINRKWTTQNLIHSAVGHQLQSFQIDQINGELKLVSTQTVFPDGKSTINCISEQINNSCSILCCSGEKELYLYNRITTILFACNRLCLMKILDKEGKMQLEKTQVVAFSHSAVILSGLISGTSWISLEVYVGTIFGPIHLFKPAQHGFTVVESFNGHNKFTRGPRFFDCWKHVWSTYIHQITTPTCYPKAKFKRLASKSTFFLQYTSTRLLLSDESKSLYHFDAVKRVSNCLLNDSSLRLSSLVASPDSKYVSLTSTDYLYLVSTKTLVSKAIPLNSVPLSTVWIRDCLLVVLIDGTSMLYKIDEEHSYDVVAKFDLKIKTSIFCALMLEKHLVLGTRTGLILVVEKSENTESWSLKNIQREHEGESVTDMCLEPTSNIIWTIGRDGCWKQWKFGNNSLELTSSIHLLEWPCKFVFVGHKSYVAGFVSDQFHLIDLETQLSLCNYKCGGGNHQWQLSKEFQFDFLSRGSITCVQLHLFDIQHFYKAPHCDQIAVLKEYTSLSNEKYVITGGLDGQLVCSKWTCDKPDGADFKTLFSADGHFGSILDIHLLNRRGLLVSVGSRCELVFWQMDFEAMAFKQLFSKRLPAVSFVLFSDGTLRCYSVILLRKSMSKCFTSSIDCHSMYSTFELFKQFVFLISTCGQLHCYTLDLNSVDSALTSTSSTPHYKSVHQVKLENAGLSALAINMFEMHTIKTNMILPALLAQNSCYAHSSTVTDVKIIPFASTCEVLSIGLDCQISIMEYCLTKRKLTQKTILLLNLADPSSFLCWPETVNNASENEILCLVAGSGLESIEIKNQ